MSDTTQYEFWWFSVAAMICYVALIAYQFGGGDWSVNAVFRGGGSRIRLTETCVSSRVVSAVAL
jgi:hypothetical protein